MGVLEWINLLTEITPTYSRSHSNIIWQTGGPLVEYSGQLAGGREAHKVHDRVPADGLDIQKPGASGSSGLQEWPVPLQEARDDLRLAVGDWEAGAFR